MTKPELANLSLAPIMRQQYERYLPTAFDESLTLLQKVNKIIDFINQLSDSNGTMLENWNQLLEWIENGSLTEDVANRLNEWLENGTLTNLTLSRFSPVGENALKTKDSLYLPNDANLFGYHPDGTHTNIGTVQENDILQYGDTSISTVWLMSGGYHSLRSPNNPSYQKIDSAGNPIGVGRTIKHQENSSYHLRVIANGEHVLTKDVYTDLHTLGNVLHVFPSDAYNNFAYIIPREGMYHFNLQLKIKTPPLAKGAIRVSISKLSAGVTTITDMSDLFYDPAVYGTPFLNTSFDWKFEKDDQVIVKVKPLTENVTIEEGTRLQIYVLGDTIQV